MHDVGRIVAALRSSQRAMFRECERRGLTRKVIALDTGIPLSTLGTYIRGEATMPLEAVIALMGTVPDDLLSLLPSIGGRAFVAADGEDPDLDAIGREAAHFTADLMDSKVDGVVTPMARDRLRGRVASLAAVTRRAA